MSPSRRILIITISGLSTFVLVLYLLSSGREPVKHATSRSNNHPKEVTRRPDGGNDEVLLRGYKGELPSLGEDWGKGIRKHLKRCDKTVLYEMTGPAGFASEYLIYLRGLAWAEAHGYEFIVDDSRWNYGRLESYFRSPNKTLRCSPSPEAWKTENHMGVEGWEGMSMLKYGRFIHDSIYRANDWVIADLLPEALPSPPSHPPSTPLPLDQTLIPELLPSFRAMKAALDRVWHVNDEIAQGVEALVRDLGLHMAKRERGPIIGLHVRGGDKSATECFDGQCDDIDIPLQSVHSLLSSFPRQAYSREHAPTIALMTVEPGVYDGIMNHRMMKEGGQLSALGVRVVEIPKGDSLEEWEQGKGHDEASFNTIPKGLITSDTRNMLRNLMVLSQHADAFVVSSSSNLGRLAILLGGEDGNVKSKDLRFFATVWPS